MAVKFRMIIIATIITTVMALVMITVGITTIALEMTSTGLMR